MGKSLKCYTKITVVGDATVTRWYHGWTTEPVTGGNKWRWQSEATFEFKVDTITAECVCLYATWEEIGPLGDAESSMDNLKMDPTHSVSAASEFQNSTFDFTLVHYLQTTKVCKTMPDEDGVHNAGDPNPEANGHNDTLCEGFSQGGPCGPFISSVNTNDGATNAGSQNQGGSLDLAWNDAIDKWISQYNKSAPGESNGSFWRPPPGMCDLEVVDCSRKHSDDPPNMGGTGEISTNNQSGRRGNDNYGGPGNSRRTRASGMRILRR